MITKEQEPLIRKEFSLLRDKVKKSNKELLKYLKKDCPNLRKIYKASWDINDEEIIEDVKDNSAKNLIYDLRNR